MATTYILDTLNAYVENIKIDRTPAEAVSWTISEHATSARTGPRSPKLTIKFFTPFYQWTDPVLRSVWNQIERVSRSTPFVYSLATLPEEQRVPFQYLGSLTPEQIANVRFQNTVTSTNNVLLSGLPANHTHIFREGDYIQMVNTELGNTSVLSGHYPVLNVTADVNSNSNGQAMVPLSDIISYTGSASNSRILTGADVLFIVRLTEGREWELTGQYGGGALLNDSLLLRSDYSQYAWQ